jgi:periplasmic divalent cation tolerance protein
MSASLLYITAKDAGEATSIGRALVNERLAACANIFSPIHSVYRWKGAVEECGEVLLVAKTRQTLVKKVVKRVKALHSYECPCIVALPITGGNPAYLAWIDDETDKTAPQ